MEPLRQYIASLMDLPEKSWETLQPALSREQYAKGQDLLSAGEVCNALFFIVDGYCRAIFDEAGQEISTAFFLEGEIATNIESFGGGTPSKFSLRAGEPLTVIRFDKAKLRAATIADPAIDTLGRQCLQRIAGKQETLAAIHQRMDPEERYTFLEREYPALLQRVPLTYLASFLGIARETLSRIRSRRS